MDSLLDLPTPPFLSIKGKRGQSLRRLNELRNVKYLNMAWHIAAVQQASAIVISAINNEA